MSIRLFRFQQDIADRILQQLREKPRIKYRIEAGLCSLQIMCGVAAVLYPRIVKVIVFPASVTYAQRIIADNGTMNLLVNKGRSDFTVDLRPPVVKLVKLTKKNLAKYDKAWKDYCKEHLKINAQTMDVYITLARAEKQMLEQREKDFKKFLVREISRYLLRVKATKYKGKL